MPGTLSAFFDECGQENKFQPDAKYYLLTVVLYDQSDPIDEIVAGYEANLHESSLPDVPATLHFDAGCGRARDLITSEDHDFGGGSEVTPRSVHYWLCER